MKYNLLLTIILAEIARDSKALACSTVNDCSDYMVYESRNCLWCANNLHS